METDAPAHSPGTTTSSAHRWNHAVDNRSGPPANDPAVSRAGIFCGFDFAAENLYAPPSAPAADHSSLPPTANEDCCAFANREAARLVVHEQKIPFDVVAEPVAENSNIIPFPRDQIRPWHLAAHLFDDRDPADRDSDYGHSLSVAHTWQVIDGSGE